MRAHVSTSRGPRRIAGALVALTIAGALVTGFTARGDGASTAVAAAADNSPQTTMQSIEMDMPADATTATQPLPTEADLDLALRNLFEQHMEWTYSTICAFAEAPAALPASLDRLLQNQVDIGNAIKPYYGAAAGDELAGLLTAHITGFVPILQAAQSGDTVALQRAEAAEYANASDIGDFLAAANPAAWDKAQMEAMMTTHITQTIAYAADILTQDYASAVSDYGTAEAHMTEMADALAQGIAARFPSKFQD